MASVDWGMYVGHIYAMKRTTVFLDEATLVRLQRTAQRTGVSAAALVREAVAIYLAGSQTAAAVPEIAGQFSSGHADTSERVDELLWRDPHQ
jgi:predicted transcriptional regulator